MVEFEGDNNIVTCVRFFALNSLRLLLRSGCSLCFFPNQTAPNNDFFGFRILGFDFPQYCYVFGTGGFARQHGIDVGLLLFQLVL